MLFLYLSYIAKVCGKIFVLPNDANLLLGKNRNWLIHRLLIWTAPFFFPLFSLFSLFLLQPLSLLLLAFTENRSKEVKRGYIHFGLGKGIGLCVRGGVRRSKQQMKRLKFTKADEHTRTRRTILRACPQLPVLGCFVCEDSQQKSVWANFQQWRGKTIQRPNKKFE